MSDIALLWDPGSLAGDLVLSANDLAATDGLEVAVLLSLFLDRRADPNDVLPDGQTDARGWWGDEFSSVGGDLTGSRLWLLAREKETTDVLRRAEQYARESLQWLIDDDVATSVSVDAEWFRPGALGLTISIVRISVPPVTLRQVVNLTTAPAASVDGAIDFPLDGGFS